MGHRKHAKPSLILASASPQRRALLRRVLPGFRILPARISERINPLRRPADLVRSLALKKASHVRRCLLRRGVKEKTWILAADTLVFLRKRVFGKPSSPGAAQRTLGSLSGHWHRVYTGVALLEAKGTARSVGHQVTWVRMRKLSGRELKAVSSRHLDKSGAYSVQEVDDPLVDRIRGDYNNVVGLPLRLVRKLLKKSGFKGSSIRVRRASHAAGY